MLAASSDNERDVPRVYIGKAELRYKRLRLAVDVDFLDAVAFLGSARVARGTSVVRCRAIPKGPPDLPFYVQLIPQDEADDYALTDSAQPLYEHAPAYWDASAEATEAARWVAEWNARRIVDIATTASVYRIDIPRWLRIALNLDAQRPMLALFVWGAVVELYNVHAWYQRLALFEPQLRDEEGREAVVQQIRRWS